MIRNNILGVVATACLAVGLSAAPAAAAPACEGVAAQDRNVRTCTTTTADAVLGPIISSNYRYKIQDAGPDGRPEVYRTYFARSQTETVQETVTVVTTVRGKVTSTSTSTRIVSSEVLPISCFRQDQPLNSAPFGYFPAPFQDCAQYGLFAGTTQPVQPSGAADACLTALAEAKGRKSCTTTSQRLGDVIDASTIVRPFGDPFNESIFTGTSRRVETVETTYTAFKGAISTSERVLSSEVQPLSCTQTSLYRGFVQGSGAADLTKCGDLGLFRA